MLGKVHKVEIYIEVPREGPENLLYSMVRKAERKPPEMMEEKQELQYHGFEDPRSVQRWWYPISCHQEISL